MVGLQGDDGVLLLNLNRELRHAILMPLGRAAQWVKSQVKMQQKREKTSVKFWGKKKSIICIIHQEMIKNKGKPRVYPYKLDNKLTMNE